MIEQWMATNNINAPTGNNPDKRISVFRTVTCSNSCSPTKPCEQTYNALVGKKTQKVVIAVWFCYGSLTFGLLFRTLSRLPQGSAFEL